MIITTIIFYIDASILYLFVFLSAHYQIVSKIGHLWPSLNDKYISGL